MRPLQESAVQTCENPLVIIYKAGRLRWFVCHYNLHYKAPVRTPNILSAGVEETITPLPTAYRREISPTYRMQEKKTPLLYTECRREGDATACEVQKRERLCRQEGDALLPHTECRNKETSHFILTAQERKTLNHRILRETPLHAECRRELGQLCRQEADPLLPSTEGRRDQRYSFTTPGPQQPL